MATDGGTILILANELHYVVLVVGAHCEGYVMLRRYIYVPRLGTYISS